MYPRSIRRLWFFGTWLLVPWPLLIVQDAWVPAVRYLLLGVVAAIVGLAEGAAGPVGLLTLLLLGWGLLASLLCWLLAFAITKLLLLSPVQQYAAPITMLLLGVGLFWALFFEPYRTPFGRALRGGLLQVLS